MLLSEGVKGMKGGAGGKGQMKPKNVRWCLPRCKQRPTFKPSQGNVTPPPYSLASEKKNLPHVFNKISSPSCAVYLTYNNLKNHKYRLYQATNVFFPLNVKKHL